MSCRQHKNGQWKSSLSWAATPTLSRGQWRCPGPTSPVSARGLAQPPRSAAAGVCVGLLFAIDLLQRVQSRCCCRCFQETPRSRQVSPRVLPWPHVSPRGKLPAGSSLLAQVSGHSRRGAPSACPALLPGCPGAAGRAAGAAWSSRMLRGFFQVWPGLPAAPAALPRLWVGAGDHGRSLQAGTSVSSADRVGARQPRLSSSLGCRRSRDDLGRSDLTRSDGISLVSHTQVTDPIWPHPSCSAMRFPHYLPKLGPVSSSSRLFLVLKFSLLISSPDPEGPVVVREGGQSRLAAGPERRGAATGSSRAPAPARLSLRALPSGAPTLGAPRRVTAGLEEPVKATSPKHSLGPRLTSCFFVSASLAGVLRAGQWLWSTGHPLPPDPP